MIDYTTWQRIQDLHEQERLEAPQIARKLSIAVNTVRTWMGKPYRVRRGPVRKSKLDPFKGMIMGWLRQYADYTAVQILGLLREEGYDGGISILKTYISQVRPRQKEAYLTLSFAPGECAQVDWGCWNSVDVGNTRRRLSFFVMVLCYSRRMYVEFTLGQSQEHFLACHRHAFEYFGGVPEKIMCDNCKTAVLSHPRGLLPVFNPRYNDFAAHYGFKIKACNAGKGNEKGIVENAVGYVKHNFLAGRPIAQFATLNPAVRIWMEQTADVRIHGRTHLRPIDMFVAEKPALGALSPHPYDCALISSVNANTQFRVRVDANRYSVPAAYAGCKMVLKLYSERICLYDGDKLAAEHVRSYERNRDIEDPDHAKALIEHKRRASEQQIFNRFLALGPQAEIYYRKLVERKLSWRQHLRKIMALAEVYGPDKVSRAMDDAIEYHAFSSDYIANILEQRERRLPDPGPLNLIRKQDHLEFDLPAPDLSIYDLNEGDNQ